MGCAVVAAAVAVFFFLIGAQSADTGALGPNTTATYIGIGVFFAIVAIVALLRRR